MLTHIVITNDKIMSSRIPILLSYLCSEVNTVYAQDKYHLNTGLFGYSVRIHSFLVEIGRHGYSAGWDFCKDV